MKAVLILVGMTITEDLIEEKKLKKVSTCQIAAVFTLSCNVLESKNKLKQLTPPEVSGAKLPYPIVVITVNVNKAAELNSQLYVC